MAGLPACSAWGSRVGRFEAAAAAAGDALLGLLLGLGLSAIGE
jgi:hypothetical protein